jgi:hypothetical protein
VLVARAQAPSVPAGVRVIRSLAELPYPQGARR